MSPLLLQYLIFLLFSICSFFCGHRFSWQPLALYFFSPPLKWCCFISLSFDIILVVLTLINHSDRFVYFLVSLDISFVALYIDKHYLRTNNNTCISIRCFVKTYVRVFWLVVLAVVCDCFRTYVRVFWLVVLAVVCDCFRTYVRVFWLVVLAVVCDCFRTYVIVFLLVVLAVVCECFRTYLRVFWLVVLVVVCDCFMRLIICC